MTGQELDRHVRGELATLSKDNATQVARHLVMTFTLIDEDPQAALRHAMAAQRRAGRVGLVREAAGLAAYRAGEYDQALRELRTARRLTGSQEHLAVMADCERGLGRPDRALALAASPEARSLDRFTQLELLIVAAGARQDLGQPDAAVVLLQVPELKAPPGPSTARLLSAYADALQAAGRHEEARVWLHRAGLADTDGSTGAARRAGLLTDDEEITDLLEEDESDATWAPGPMRDTGAALGDTGAAAGGQEQVAASPLTVPADQDAVPARQSESAAVAAPAREALDGSGVDSSETDSSANTPGHTPASEPAPSRGTGVPEVLFSDAPAQAALPPADGDADDAGDPPTR